MRNYVSTRLLWTAFHASDRAREIEAAHTGNSTFDIEHNAYVLSAVVSSAGFLEAAINEFFQDAHDGHGLKADEYLAPLPADAIEAMAATWRDTDQGFRLNALEKWQLMLTFAGRAALDRGAAPFQDAQSVTLLRNAILHFRPEDMGGDDPHALEKQLRGKFAENQLMTGNPWWPDRCLGHGCAVWAAESALAFADHVCVELGINPNYQRIAASGWIGKIPGSWGT